MMLNEHQELEIKLEADSISVEEFKSFAIKKAHGYLYIEGYDHFWLQGENVIRHRVKEDGASELTVKKRKSKASTQDREEIDLPIKSKAKASDVTAWLKLAGFSYSFTLFKKAHIFRAKKAGHCFDLVIYTVASVDEDGICNDEKTFLEVEIDKNADTTLDNGKRLLRDWKQEIQQHFKIDNEPVNRSLYEIYALDKKG